MSHEWTTPSLSHALALEQVIERLQAREQVAGLLTVGSLAQSTLTPASDYDLVVILSHATLPLHVVLTTIGGRLADLLFVTMDQIEQILALDAPLEPGEPLAPIVRWLAAGQLCYDRSGQIAQAQRKVQDSAWVRTPSALAAYGAWFRLNYNLAHTRRLLRSEDPVYRAAAELRLSLYGPQDLLYGYWEMRALQWTGEKAAVRTLEGRDPAYLETYLRFLRERDLARKLALYEELAARAVEPHSPLWPEDATAVTFDGAPASPDQIQAGLKLWQNLIAGA
jgi:hypothetical protein